MSSWARCCARWIMSWLSVVDLTWLTSTISWLGRKKDNILTEQDIESVQKATSTIADVSYETLSKEQIKQKINELQISTRNAGGRLIGVGVFAHVYDLGDGRVRKVASPNPNHPDLTLNSIRREREIYKHLGDHPRVIKCLATGDLFVELEYASRGHVESYLKSHDTTEECRIRFAHEMIEAVVFIHSRGVIHSDLAARQFLLDSTLHVHLSDFGFSSFSDGDVLGFENASHHLPRDIDSDVASTIQSDLFALGSTLYEVMAGKPPYEGKSDDVITQLYSSGSFPCVEGILCGDIIMGCWQGQLKSSTEVLQIFTLQFSVTTI